MTFSNIVHETKHYCSASAITIRNGIAYCANVINKPKDQYTVITRVNTRTGETKELRRLHARDSEAYAIKEGADPTLNNGKHGNVGISVEGADIYLILEVRINDINKPKWIVLKGLAT